MSTHDVGSRVIESMNVDVLLSRLGSVPRHSSRLRQILLVSRVVSSTRDETIAILVLRRRESCIRTKRVSKVTLQRLNEEVEVEDED